MRDVDRPPPPRQSRPASAATQGLLQFCSTTGEIGGRAGVRALSASFFNVAILKRRGELRGSTLLRQGNGIHLTLLLLQSPFFFKRMLSLFSLFPFAFISFSNIAHGCLRLYVPFLPP
jgi:hypothetical protein